MKFSVKKLGLLGLTAVLLSSLMACGNDEVADEILHYSNVDLVTIAEQEAIVTDAYDAVSGDNYTDDLTMYTAIVDVVIPASCDLIEMSEELTFTSEDLREVHELYISSVNTQHQAFTMIVAALESQDYELITQANELLNDARKSARDFNVALVSLGDEHDIVFEE